MTDMAILTYMAFSGAVRRIEAATPEDAARIVARPALDAGESSVVVRLWSPANDDSEPDWFIRVMRNEDRIETENAASIAGSYEYCAVAAQKADIAAKNAEASWVRELRKEFGARGWRDARWTERGESTPRLAELCASFRAASDEAERLIQALWSFD